MTAVPSAPPGLDVKRRGSEVELRLTGDWIARQTGLRDSAAVTRVLTEAGDATRLSFDTSGLGNWDSALIAFVRALHVAARDTRLKADEADLPAPARRLLALAGGTVTADPAGHEQPAVRLSARVGLWTMARWAELTAVAALVGETVLSVGGVVRGRVLTRAGDVLELMRGAGAGALLIVAIVNALVGGILAFVGAVQLRRFGAESFVAALVGITMVRELASVMTAIVMAGRTGGAYAAHIATMQGNEEIDALRALGIPVYDYLVLPRVAALIAMMPLLYLYGCAAGLLGGLVVGVTAFGLSPTSYWQETRQAISGTQFVFGAVKSVAFGALIALAGCHIGLRAGRSAADVGLAATSAVVVGIIGVIALDALFAVCANALGI